MSSNKKILNIKAGQKVDVTVYDMQCSTHSRMDNFVNADVVKKLNLRNSHMDIIEKRVFYQKLGAGNTTISNDVKALKLISQQFIYDITKVGLYLLLQTIFGDD